MDDDKNSSWPAWYYGPNGEAEIFQSKAEVPTGWKDHPFNPGEAKAAPKPTAAPVAAPKDDDTAETDADGWPWSAELHAASKSKTTAGLWRMKVGLTRPDPKKPPLDL